MKLTKKEILVFASMCIMFGFAFYGMVTFCNQLAEWMGG